MYRESLPPRRHQRPRRHGSQRPTLHWRGGPLVPGLYHATGARVGGSPGGANPAELQRVLVALVDAGDDHFDNALAALARLAVERPDSHASRPRLCTAAVYDMLGQADEGHQWTAGIPEDACLPHPREKFWFKVALLAAALGGALGATAGLKAGETRPKIGHAQPFCLPFGLKPNFGLGPKKFDRPMHSQHKPRAKLGPANLPPRIWPAACPSW
ncbi:hypothetical protein ACP70R_037535 [Stipagrostis hirtigluma subsp. patula]